MTLRQPNRLLPDRLRAGAGSFAAGHPHWFRLGVAGVSAIGCHLILNLVGRIMFFDDGWAVCWPMSGIMVAVLLMNRRTYWPWILLGFACSQVLAERKEARSEIALVVACIVAETLVAALALPAYRGLNEWMRQPRLVLRFIGIPLVIAPMLTAIPVGLYYRLEQHKSFWTYATRWGFADTLGIVLWVPLVFVLCSRETHLLFRQEALPRTLSLLGLLAFCSWLIFYHQPYPVAFMIMPVLLLVALQMGFSGSVLAVTLLNMIATPATLHGHGPFLLIASSFHEYRIIALQTFLAVAMLMSFPLSIVLLERDAFQSRLEAAYERVARLATKDGLTGIANRRHFDTVLEEEWRRARRDTRPLSLLMIDADCFKLFNDHYGHLAGDDCLRRIAAVLESLVQRGGDLVARYGGEEFVMLLPQTDLDGALQVADLLRFEVEDMQLPHTRNAHQVVTVSIGCSSLVPGENALPDSLIKIADEALYLAKQKGRNRVETASSAAQESLVTTQA